MSGETHYKAMLEAARVRKRSFDRGSRLADVVRSVTEDIPEGDRDFCDHDTPYGCYAEGYAAGMASARTGRQGDTLEVIARLRQVLTRFEAASE